MTRDSSALRWFAHAVLLGGGFVMVYPLIYAVLGSLMTPYEFVKNGSLFPIAHKPNFGIYWEMLTFKDMPYWIRNTLIRIVWVIGWGIVTSVVLGYFFSKGKFLGKTSMFYVLLSTMMIPAVTTMVPTYLVFARFPWAGGNNVFFGGHGLLDTWGVFLLPGLVQVYSMFLVKQMYDTLPNDYEESARMDGAGTFRIIFQMYAPMLKPVISVVFVLDFVGIWNDFLTNMVYTNGEGRNMIMLAYGITKLPTLLNVATVNSEMVRDTPGLFASVVIATVPTVAVYLFLQKYIVQGLSMSGLKG